MRPVNPLLVRRAVEAFKKRRIILDYMVGGLNDAMTAALEAARIIHAPFTSEEVDALNAFQANDYVHPFTCPTNHVPDRRPMATQAGWICPHCDYKQDWAHGFMLENPLLQTWPFPPTAGDADAT